MSDAPAIFAEQPLTLSALAQRLVAFASLEPVLSPSAPIGDHGGVHQRDRIAAVAEWACASGIPGDLIEIGCYSGETTERLCQVARKHGRRVVAVDNWEAGTPYDLAEKVWPAFSERMTPYVDVLDIHRADATSEETRGKIQQRRFALAFVDASKGHEDNRAYLRAVMPVCDGPIAVDDAYSLDVLRACDEMARENPPWNHLRLSGLRETWLVRAW